MWLAECFCSIYGPEHQAITGLGTLLTFYHRLGIDRHTQLGWVLVDWAESLLTWYSLGSLKWYSLWLDSILEHFCTLCVLSNFCVWAHSSILGYWNCHYNTIKSRRCRQVGCSVDTEKAGFFIPKVSLWVSHFGHMLKPLHIVDTYASTTQISDIVVFCGHCRLTCHKRLT